MIQTQVKSVYLSKPDEISILATYKTDEKKSNQYLINNYNYQCFEKNIDL